MSDRPDSDRDPHGGENSGAEAGGPRDQAGFEEPGPGQARPLGEASRDDEDDGPGGGEGGGGGGGHDDEAEADGDAMGLLDHLGELRTVIFHSSIAALAATILCWFWSADLLDLLIMPIKDEGVYFTAPNEAFLVRLKISAAVGMFVVAPFIFFKLYGFVLPGLYRRERRLVTPLLTATTALFYTGVAFAFLVVVPQVIKFLMSFGTTAMAPLIGVGPYFNFVSRLCLAFGLVFELPLLVLALSAAGVVNPRLLLRTWRIAVVAIFAASAILTPPDVISQVMMAGPVLVLYMGSVLISILVTRKRRNQD